MCYFLKHVITSLIKWSLALTHSRSLNYSIQCQSVCLLIYSYQKISSMTIYFVYKFFLSKTLKQRFDKKKKQEQKKPIKTKNPKPLCATKFSFSSSIFAKSISLFNCSNNSGDRSGWKSSRLHPWLFMIRLAVSTSTLTPGR